MASVHRNGLPPKKLLHRKTISFMDFQFNEEAICQWARENLEHPMQYDFVVFNGSKGRLNQSITLKVWFQTKHDADTFEKRWIK